VEIRRAVLPDLPEVAGIARLAYAVYVPRLDGREPPPMYDDFGAAIRSGNVNVVVSEHRVVGYVVLVPAEDHLLVSNVAVLPELQGRGVGGQLLRYAELSALRLRVPEIRLYTNVVMTENLEIYAHLGYAETGRRTEDGLSRVFLAKPMPTGIAALVHLFYAVLWNEWDDSLVDDVLTEDFAFRGSLGTETSGRDGWRSYRDTVRAGSPDFHNELVYLIAYGDRAAARLHYTGHHHGRLAGLEPTGRAFEYAGAAFFTARDDKLATAWVLGDLSSLHAQLTGHTNPEP
jgi:predicted ester cyclase/ribosomal protein S18 acetylase RimI-like enzyme